MGQGIPRHCLLHLLTTPSAIPRNLSHKMALSSGRPISLDISPQQIRCYTRELLQNIQAR